LKEVQQVYWERIRYGFEIKMMYLRWYIQMKKGVKSQIWSGLKY